MGPLGWQETIFIFVLALLIFGPKKLPELGRTIGKAMTEFRRASSELRSTFDREMRTLERETDSINKEVATENYDTYNYDYSSYDSGYYDSGSTTETSATENTATASASASPGAESQPAAAAESTDPVIADNTSPEQPYGTVAYGSEPNESPADGVPAAEKKA
jgi:TatA/E family protein of Tat protein translocase